MSYRSYRRCTSLARRSGRSRSCSFSRTSRCTGWCRGWIFAGGSRRCCSSGLSLLRRWRLIGFWSGGLRYVLSFGKMRWGLTMFGQAAYFPAIHYMLGEFIASRHLWHQLELELTNDRVLVPRTRAWPSRWDVVCRAAAGYVDGRPRSGRHDHSS